MTTLIYTYGHFPVPEETYNLEVTARKLRALAPIVEQGEGLAVSMGV